MNKFLGGWASATALCLILNIQEANSFAINSPLNKTEKNTAVNSIQENGIIGSWNGTLKISGQELPLVFHIKMKEGKLNASMDSPLQNAFNIPVDSVSFQDGKLNIKINLLQLNYDGVLDSSNSKIKGTFNQGPISAPMELNKKEQKEGSIDPSKRPQDPIPPFNYDIEEVTFQNEDISLSGTLTLPKGNGPFSAIVLVNGSGPQNRDSEIFNHRPFHVLADYFTKKGYAVLRYDDREVGKSTGKFLGSTTYDFAEDALEAVNFLANHPKIDKNKIGVMGHSEGGMIAPIVANKAENLQFIVLLAGPGIPIPQLLNLQNQAVLKSSGATEEMIALNNSLVNGGIEILQSHNGSQEELIKKMDDLFHKINPNLPQNTPLKEKFFAQMLDPWMQSFVTFPVQENLKKVNCPILAVNGSKDLQVTPENLYAIKDLLKDKVTVKEFPDLNHLFQTSETGNPNEYFQIQETFNEEVMDFIANWLTQIN